jgi:Na+-transporting NADH:ubiquinone oxidoreductase subunit C
METDSIKKTIIVALAVCIVCSILVSTSAILLKPRVDKNRKVERLKNILDVSDLLEEGKKIESIFKEKVTPVIITLEEGKELPKESYTKMINPDEFDIIKISKDKKLTQAIPKEKDTAEIRREPKYGIVYFVKKDNINDKIIFPIYGKGLWSTMYGFLALDAKDLNTIKGITFYEHGETPGLGGEIDNPIWKQSWKGKKLFARDGSLKMKVIKGKANPQAEYQIDGLSGATITTRGVDNTIKFWFRDSGFTKFLEKLREEMN